MPLIHLTPEQATEFLQQELGVQVAVVSDPQQATADFSSDELLAEIDTAREPILKAKIGETIEKETRSKIGGTMNGAMRSATLQLLKAKGVQDVSNKDLEALSDKALLAYAFERLETTFGKGDKVVEDLRKQLSEMSSVHEKELAEKLAEKEAEIQAANQRYMDRDIDLNLLETVNAIPRTGGNPAAQSAALKEHLKSQYALVYNPETKKTELRDKASPEKPVLTAAGGKIVTLEDAGKTYFDSLGLLAKDTRHINPNEAMENAGAVGGARADAPAHNAISADDYQKDIERFMPKA